MIGYIAGKVRLDGPHNVIIITAGVGYDLHCSQQTMAELHEGQSVELWVHTHVREDALTLFGFATKLERELFHDLLKVNGIGPKMAINILSAAPVQQLVAMIESGDAKVLAQLPKVGKKTAEQMVLTLKGKLSMVGPSTAMTAKPQRGELISALVHLGFRLQDVEKVVADMEPTVELEDGVRRALLALTN